MKKLVVITLIVLGGCAHAEFEYQGVKFVRDIFSTDTHANKRGIVA